MAEQSGRGSPAWYDEPGTAFLPKQQTPAEGGETARHIAEIEERLRNVTPGPWSSYDENGCSDDEPCWWVSGPAMVDAGESAYFTEADATFIAAAPTDIARLLAIVRRQRELLAECAVPLLDCSTQCPRLMKADTDLTALRGQVERMRVALEDARHELTIVHGLSASDRVSAYGHAQEMGADANGAWGAFCETLFTIDTSAELAIIDAALATASTGGKT